MDDNAIAAILTALALLAAPLLASGLIRALDRPARRVGLVDSPDARKRHGADVSLAGGPAMLLAFAVVLLVTGAWSAHYTGLLAVMALVCLAGMLDDRFGLAPAIKFALQLAAAVLLVTLGDLSIGHLGAITGGDPVTLGAWSIPFTLLCVVGLVNAINMIDGLDGLAGGTVAVMLGALVTVALIAGTPRAALGPALLLAVLAGFLAHNFPRLRRQRIKVFMGDAGSMMLGLALAWFAIDIAFHHGADVPPMTFAWILALPVLDTVVLMARRVLRGRNPMISDREHVHHVLLRGRLSPTATVRLVALLSALTAAVGIGGWQLAVPEHWLFAGFFALGFAHLAVVRFAWRIAAIMRRRRQSTTRGPSKPRRRRPGMDTKPARR